MVRLRAAGSPIGLPVTGSRVRPDGEVVRWVCAFPELGPERPPFLIEHETAGAEWGEEARAARAAFRHPGGGRVRLTALELPVADHEQVASEYRAVLGLAFDQGWRAVVGEQSVVLSGEAGGKPVIELAGEPGTAPLDVERFGVRWRRVPALCLAPRAVRGRHPWGTATLRGCPTDATSPSGPPPAVAACGPSSSAPTATPRRPGRRSSSCTR